MQQEEDLTKTQKETFPTYHQYVCTSCIGKIKCSTSRWQHKFRNYHEVSKQSIGKSNFSSSLLQHKTIWSSKSRSHSFFQHACKKTIGKSKYSTCLMRSMENVLELGSILNSPLLCSPKLSLSTRAQSRLT